MIGISVLDINDFQWYKPDLAKGEVLGTANGEDYYCWNGDCWDMEDTKAPSMSQQKELTSLILRYTQDKYSTYNLLKWEMDGDSVVLTLGSSQGTMVLKIFIEDLFAYPRSLKEKNAAEKQIEFLSRELGREDALALKSYLEEHWPSYLVNSIDPYVNGAERGARVSLFHIENGKHTSITVPFDYFTEEGLAKVEPKAGVSPSNTSYSISMLNGKIDDDIFERITAWAEERLIYVKAGPCEYWDPQTMRTFTISYERGDVCVYEVTKSAEKPKEVLGVDIPYFGTEDDYVKSGLR